MMKRFIAILLLWASFGASAQSGQKYVTKFFYDTIKATNVFRLPGDNISKIDLKIYNRWGALIFETKDNSVGWDGTTKKNECPEGVYYFTADVTYTDGKNVVKNGNITLMRQLIEGKK
jgi:gliding motility-associated-like protein